MHDQGSLQIKRVTLVDAVVEQMVEAIKSGRFKEGEKIPSEKMLTKEFGVSRTTLREAFKKLEYFGVLSIKQGNGTYVTDSNAVSSLIHPEEEENEQEDVTLQEDYDQSMALLGESGVKEVVQSMFVIGNYQLSHYIEARCCIEREALRLAVERMEERDIARIEKNLEKQALCTTPEEYIDLDFEFHSQIIMMSRNEFLFQFWSALRPFINEQMKRVIKVEGFKKHSHSYHRKILNALKEKDYRKAYRLGTDHVRIVQGRMLVAASTLAGTSQEKNENRDDVF